MTIQIPLPTALVILVFLCATLAALLRDAFLKIDRDYYKDIVEIAIAKERLQKQISENYRSQIEVYKDYTNWIERNVCGKNFRLSEGGSL